MRKVTDRESGLVTGRVLKLCAAFALAVGLLTASLMPASAQTERAIRRAGFQKQKRLRAERQSPASELNPEAQSDAAQTENPQAQSVPDERLIPLGIGPRQRMAMVRVFNQLNLSADQRARLFQLRRETGNRLLLLNRKRQIQNEELDEVMYGASFDPKMVEQKANDLAATTTEIIRLQSSILSQIRQIMTPEQALKFRELMQEELRRPAALPRQNP